MQNLNLQKRTNAAGNGYCVSEIHFAERRRIIWGGYSLINRQLRLLQATVSENGKLWWYVDGVKTYGG